jgi:hypothetical protein
MKTVFRHMYFVLLVVLAGPPGAAIADTVLRDRPVVWYENDRADIEEPAEREPSILWDYFDDSWGWPRERWTDPNRLIRNFGTLFGGDQVKPAANINALDEVPNSTWFTNRIGLFPMSPADAARGPGRGTGPDRSGKWTVISAKTEGVTPGFNIRDAAGDVYLIKFDPRGCLNATTAAGVISNRILYAAGYNVPEDVSVVFRREDIAVGDGARIKGPGDVKRPMTEDDVDAILARVDRLNETEWIALSSKFLSGKPVGPFDYRSRRKDDRNDRVDHEHRRELRGFYVFAAWLNHYDTKQHNSLDMYVAENGRRFIKHHFIDFASTLGAGANGLNPRYGYEFGFDVVSVARRAATLGLVEDTWRTRNLDHGFTEVGYFDSETFRPDKFRPLQPNHAFANTTARDGYWAAKIVAAFRDEHIRAIVAEGGYREPGAAGYVTRILCERRDKIARHYFDRITPLDYFRARDGALVWDDLGIRYNLYPASPVRYRVRCAMTDKNRSDRKDSRTGWIEVEPTVLRLDEGAAAAALEYADSRYRFLKVECQLDRGDGWSDSVTAFYAPRSGRVIAVDR